MASSDVKAKYDPKTRGQLKKYFENGKLPSEKDFSDLIDSMINKKDDDFSKHPVDSLRIRAIKDNQRYITLYGNEGDSYFKLDNDVRAFEKSLKIQWATDEVAKVKIKENQEAGKTQVNDSQNEAYEYGKMDSAIKSEDEKENKNAFFFNSKGKFGIGKRSDNDLELDINGFAGMKGRIGTYKCGAIPADKTWYKIIGPLNRCNAFEIVARTGWAGSGKFAMLHAIAVSAFGKSSSKIRKTSSHYGAFWNKINLRWTGKPNAYFLEMRTNSNYKDASRYKLPDASTVKKDIDRSVVYEASDNNGRDSDGNVYIYYSITSLWDEDLMVPPDYFVRQNNNEKVNDQK